MPIFNISTKNAKATELSSYRFASEGNHDISPQNILANNPSIICTIPELELIEGASLMVVREFSSSRGSIDLVIITEKAEIILVETKLLRNPDSHRAVVAQAIDYTKAFVDVSIEVLKAAFLKSPYNNKELVKNVFNESRFIPTLDKNIKNGNFKVIIAGDKIHSNVLGMVESIQSAPHLAFTIYLVELSPYTLDEDQIILHPKVVAYTDEVERSVIKLEVNYVDKTHTIESSTPDKESKGSRPKLSREEYLNNLDNKDHANIIQNFWKDWREIDGDIIIGTVGFSSGIIVRGKRIPLQYVYDTTIALISEKHRSYYSISDDMYVKYKEQLKKRVPRAFDILIANKVEVKLEHLSVEELKEILDAAKELAVCLQSE